MATCKLLTKHFIKRNLSQPGITRKELRELYRKELNTTVSLTMCGRMKRKVMEEQNGRFWPAYILIYNCTKELELSNLKTSRNVKIDDENLDNILFFFFFEILCVFYCL